MGFSFGLFALNNYSLKCLEAYITSMFLKYK